ncbi:hypothetical protein EW146_g3913 [Bondarzewia mesenterica]|uniref:Cytochrome P450 n=1 Tax=Bondarzewia mesenterica TaxID=1095465 RepID=A0A4S4LW52_9AGAM|nr:hypothetical protein EW146_g3913 [Bondarzewia mesenterica]
MRFYLNDNVVLVVISFCSASAAYALFHRYRFLKASQGFPVPPGPPVKPVVGNIFAVPLATGAWKTFTQYKEQYGDLVYLHGLGTKVLVLNSIEIINDLLDKRGNIYSHRPVFTVVGELMALGQSMPLLPYGKEWREHRKLAHRALSAGAVKKYHIVQEDLAALLNKDFLEKPDEFFAHVRLTAGRIIMSITYGLPVSTADDKYITRAEETMDVIGKATVPGAFLCDMLPFLKVLPSWIPFQREAAKGKAMIENMVSTPYQHVKAEMAKGTATPSLTQDLLNMDIEDMQNFEHRVKWTAGAMYGAGGETTYATVLTFIMAMALNTDKQKLAQSEIDQVIGTEQMPTIADLPKLPYVNAVIKETMRWHPVLPLSIARRNARHDIYNGYFIPEGTIVMPNLWAVAFEPNAKYDSQKFIPERFLDPTQSIIEPSTWAFGFGRRVCPGKLLGENSVFILISTILASFDIFPPTDDTLTPEFGVNLVRSVDSIFLSYPMPFKCQIKPRSAAKAELVQRRAAQVTV